MPMPQGVSSATPVLKKTISAPPAQVGAFVGQPGHLPADAPCRDRVGQREDRQAGPPARVRHGRRVDDGAGPVEKREPRLRNVCQVVAIDVAKRTQGHCGAKVELNERGRPLAVGGELGLRQAVEQVRCLEGTAWKLLGQGHNLRGGQGAQPHELAGGNGLARRQNARH